MGLLTYKNHPAPTLSPFQRSVLMGAYVSLALPLFNSLVVLWKPRDLEAQRADTDDNLLSQFLEQFKCTM